VAARPARSAGRVTAARPARLAGTPPARRAGQLRSGSLCTGYGGLDLAVMAVLGARLAWCAESDRHAAAVLAARYPGVPNLGDITAPGLGGRAARRPDHRAHAPPDSGPRRAAARRGHAA